MGQGEESGKGDLRIACFPAWCQANRIDCKSLNLPRRQPLPLPLEPSLASLAWHVPDLEMGPVTYGE